MHIDALLWSLSGNLNWRSHDLLLSHVKVVLSNLSAPWVYLSA